MNKTTIAVIGGGAAGLFAAAQLSNLIPAGARVTVLERNDRLGKKLSATGNGQGNISNLAISPTAYFSVRKDENIKAELSKLFSRYPAQALVDFFKNLGVLTFADERGRLYPTSRQASSLTDALRFFLADKADKADVRLSSRVQVVQKGADGYLIDYVNGDGERQRLCAEYLILCTGGKAAKNFGTDGTGYALAQSLGHTVTPLYPSLVQLKTDVAYTKTLKGIRAADVKATAVMDGKERASVVGDLIFTDYGVSGDAVFRLSAYLTDGLSGCEKEANASLKIDFLPNLSASELDGFLNEKRKIRAYADGELLCGILNNQIARAVEKFAKASGTPLAETVKNFPLTVTGSLGFDYAQVTKGGVPFSEITQAFESVYAKNAYLAGELLDIDGECGGFNLHFAFASASAVAQDILSKIQKRGGQVWV